MVTTAIFRRLAGHLASKRNCQLRGRGGWHGGLRGERRRKTIVAFSGVSRNLLTCSFFIRAYALLISLARLCLSKLFLRLRKSFSLLFFSVEFFIYLALCVRYVPVYFFCLCVPFFYLFRLWSLLFHICLLVRRFLFLFLFALCLFSLCTYPLNWKGGPSLSFDVCQLQSPSNKL